MSRKFEPRSGFTVQAYQFALEPTEAQAEALRSHCGVQRKAFNWGLARVAANLGQREAERSYGVPEEQLTPSLNWSAYSLRKAWNAAKDEVAPWWAENSKEAYSSGLANLADGLSNWNASKHGQRKGPTLRFPKFKSAKRSTPSCTFTTGAFGLSNADRRHVKLPRIGCVRTGESTRKLARRLQRKAARQHGPDKRTGKQPSKRWLDTQDRIRRLHSYVANARQDGLHQLSTRLCREFDTIVIEDLNVAGMMRSRSLSRSIADVGMGELRRQTTYKTSWNGRRLVVADRFYPSSKTCSSCGVVKAKLRLRDRTFRCDNDACGLVIDRDLNASYNLAALAREVDPSSPSCGATVNEPDGNPPKTTTPSGVQGTGYCHGKADNSETVKAA